MTSDRVLMQSTDDGGGQVTSTSTFLTTLYLNIGIFCFLVTVFEFNRHLKSIYFKRLTHRFQSTNRVPSAPSKYPFAWAYEVSRVSEEDVLRMVGLDAYMMVRYLNIWLVNLISISLLVYLYII